MEITKKKTILEDKEGKLITYEITIADGEHFLAFLNEIIKEIELEKYFQIKISPSANFLEVNLLSKVDLESSEEVVNLFIKKIKEKEKEYEKILPLLKKIEETEKRICDLESKLGKLIFILEKKRHIKFDDLSTLHIFPFNILKEKWFWYTLLGFLIGIGLTLLFPLKMEIREIYKLKVDTLYVERFKRDTIYLRQTKTYYETTYCYIEKEKRDTIYQVKKEKEKEIITKEKNFNLGLFLENNFTTEKKFSPNFGGFVSLSKRLGVEGGIRYKDKNFIPYIRFSFNAFK